MLNVRATTKFARNGCFLGANGIDLDDVAIFFPETTMCFQDVTSVSLVIFSKRNWVIFLNPSINLVLNLLFLFIGKFAIKVKIETQTFRGDIRTSLSDIRIDDFLKRSQK